jgi:hypothetical protein
LSTTGNKLQCRILFGVKIAIITVTQLVFYIIPLSLSSLSPLSLLSLLSLLSPLSFSPSLSLSLSLSLLFSIYIYILSCVIVHYVIC